MLVCLYILVYPHFIAVACHICVCIFQISVSFTIQDGLSRACFALQDSICVCCSIVIGTFSVQVALLCWCAYPSLSSLESETITA